MSQRKSNKLSAKKAREVHFLLFMYALYVRLQIFLKLIVHKTTCKALH